MDDKVEGDSQGEYHDSSGIQRGIQDRPVQVPEHFPKKPSGTREGRSLLSRLFLYTFVTALIAIAIGVSFLYIDQKKRFEKLQARFDDQSEELNKSKYIAKIYKNHVELLNTVGKVIKSMYTCNLYLERYCKLIEKENSSLNDDEKEEKKSLERTLGCTGISAGYHLKIAKSFQDRFKNLLQFKEAQIDLMIAGDFDGMESEQEKSKKMPAETCRFICNLEEIEIQSGENATSLDIGRKIIEGLFNVFASWPDQCVQLCMACYYAVRYVELFLLYTCISCNVK